MNYFELFDIPVSLTVDKSMLANKYFELQKKYHPDFFTQSDNDEQADALEKSSEINKALKVLQKKDSTIQYVLKLKGLLTDDEKYQLPPDFLMEMMDLNENATGDAVSAVTVLENEIYLPVKSIIENYQDMVTSETDLLKVKEYYYKKKYLQRILDRRNG